MNHAVLVHLRSLGQHFIGVDDDAFETVIARQAQIQNGQTRLQRYRNGHFVVDLHATRAAELFVAQKQARQTAQPQQFFVATR